MNAELLRDDEVIVLTPAGGWFQVPAGTFLRAPGAVAVITRWGLGQISTTGSVCCGTCETRSPCSGDHACHTARVDEEPTGRITAMESDELGCCRACRRPENVCDDLACLCHMVKARRVIDSSSDYTGEIRCMRCRMVKYPGPAYRCQCDDAPEPIAPPAEPTQVWPACEHRPGRGATFGSPCPCQVGEEPAESVSPVAIGVARI